MSQMVGSLLFVGFLFLGMLAMLEAGRRVRSRQRDLHVEEAGPGLGAVEGAVFALMGLLVALRSPARLRDSMLGDT